MPGSTTSPPSASRRVAAPADVGTYGPDDVPSALRRLIDAFEPAPAYVLGPRWEFGAWNAAQARLYPRDRVAAPTSDRNLLWVLFADPSTRQLIVDWDLHARQALAEFRASTTALRDDPLMVAMIERLRDAAPSSTAGGPSTTSPASRPGCAASTIRSPGC